MAVRHRVLVMVSQQGHCLNDLLYRAETGTLRVDVPVIVSNHEDFRGLAQWHEIPFHHVPVTASTKPAAEAELRRLVDEYQADTIVLARYMQILSAGLCADFPGRIINIHHSLLPSFKGAKPYTQAHDRGVKVIGATAHYVTADLDEGPIIEQDFRRVDHRMSPAELASVGQELEAMALARAVRWHVEHRVILRAGAPSSSTSSTTAGPTPRVRRRLAAQERRHLGDVVDEVDGGRHATPAGERLQAVPHWHVPAPVPVADQHQGRDDALLQARSTAGSRPGRSPGPCPRRPRGPPDRPCTGRAGRPRGWRWRSTSDRVAEDVGRLVAVEPGGDADAGHRTRPSRLHELVVDLEGQRCPGAMSGRKDGTAASLARASSRRSSSSQNAPRLAASIAPGPPPVAIRSPRAARVWPRRAATAYPSVPRSSA